MTGYPWLSLAPLVPHWLSTQSQNRVATDGESVSLAWYQAPYGAHEHVLVQPVQCTLSDERTGLGYLSSAQTLIKNTISNHIFNCYGGRCLRAGYCYMLTQPFPCDGPYNHVTIFIYFVGNLFSVKNYECDEMKFWCYVRQFSWWLNSWNGYYAENYITKLCNYYAFLHDALKVDAYTGDHTHSFVKLYDCFTFFIILWHNSMG
jgi:hypothetical protein